MTDWYAPNQQAVGTEPASETTPPPEPPVMPAAKKTAAKTDTSAPVESSGES